MKNHHHDHGPKVVPVTFILEDPEGLTEADQVEWRVMASVGENILEVAIDHDIHMEHTCGGVCACSTCHVYLEEGTSEVSEADDDKEDCVEEAPGLQQNSRLACKGPGRFRFGSPRGIATLSRKFHTSPSTGR
jgi:2Fe-2S ferredoxin